MNDGWLEGSTEYKILKPYVHPSYDKDWTEMFFVVSLPLYEYVYYNWLQVKYCAGHLSCHKFKNIHLIIFENRLYIAFAGITDQRENLAYSDRCLRMITMV